MPKPILIRPESAGDPDPIRALHKAAFEAEDSIGRLVDDLRSQRGPYPTVSLVAQGDQGSPVGLVMLSHAWVDGPSRLIDVMVLSPLGVWPSEHCQGIGTALISAALAAAQDLGASMVFLEGHHLYYGPRGFENATALGFRRPSLRIPERAFQVARLAGFDAAMTGTFVYRDVHWRHGVGLYRDQSATP